MGLFDRLLKKSKEDAGSKKDIDDGQAKLVPGVGRMPYPAYRGREPYLFISYAHMDSLKVFAEIKRFNEAGFHVWYDEGIAPGNEWTDEIADALAKCSLFVVMLTPTSAPRINVQNEINFALRKNKPFLAIHLEETELPSGLELQIGTKQAILKYNMSDEEYTFKYTEAFKRMGLSCREVRVNKTDIPAPVSPAPVSPVPSAEPAPESEGKYNDSPEDAGKRASGDLVRVDGFDLEHGRVRGYYGRDKNIRLPNAAVILGYCSFGDSQRFIETVDLNKAECLLDGAFEKCPNLHTVIIPETVTTIKPNAFIDCPNLTLHVRKKQLPEGFETRFRGKKIVYLDEAAVVPNAGGHSASASPDPAPSSGTASSSASAPKIVRFTPKGIAVITMRDGTEYRAVANMLLYQGHHLEGGIALDRSDNPYDIVAFADVSRFDVVLDDENNFQCMKILDRDNEEIEYPIGQNTEGSVRRRLWFAEIVNPNKMKTVSLTEIDHVCLDHLAACNIDLQMVLVKFKMQNQLKYYLTPVSSLRTEKISFGFGGQSSAWLESFPLTDNTCPPFSKMTSFRITNLISRSSQFKPGTKAEVSVTDKYGEVISDEFSDCLWMNLHTLKGYQSYKIDNLQEIIFRGEELDKAVGGQ